MESNQLWGVVKFALWLGLTAFVCHSMFMGLRPYECREACAPCPMSLVTENTCHCDVYNCAAVRREGGG